MDSIGLLNLGPLLERNIGSNKIRIALIDGPVMTSHPSLMGENIFDIKAQQSAYCSSTDSIACNHGTFIAGILKAKRSSGAPALCPGCTLLVRPVFTEHKLNQIDAIPFTTPKELAMAIIDSVNADAHIINLSLALSNPSSNVEYELEEALNYAAKKDVIIVTAAGNQGKIGSTTITRHPWVIPVIACNKLGQPLQLSNLGSSIGRLGLSAHGENIKSLGTKNNIVTFSGTSVAVPFITGILALLWSEFPDLPASAIKQSINVVNKRRSIVPPVADAMQSFRYLNSFYHKKAIA